MERETDMYFIYLEKKREQKTRLEKDAKRVNSNFLITGKLLLFKRFMLFKTPTPKLKYQKILFILNIFQ